MDFELLAASLRADANDLSVWLPALGAKLAGALPGRVRLYRDGIFGNGAVNGMTIDLDVWRLELHLKHGRPLASRTHVVRGIALKTEELPLDAWIDALGQALAELASTSAREQAAIRSLLT
jgi:hypothetical protein